MNDPPSDPMDLVLKELASISAKLDNIEARLTSMETRFDCLEEGLKGWIGKTELRFITIEGQLVVSKTESKSIQKKLKEIVDQSKSKFDELQNQIDLVDNRIICN